MVTMKEIAKKADVSIATVSYVLNDNGQISEKTRQKVLEVVEKLNYKRNNIAKSLRTSKTNTIGVIAEDITVFNAPDIIDGINESLEKENFHVVLNNLRVHNKIINKFEQFKNHFEEIKESIAVLLSRQIDGIIYVGEHYRDVSGILDSINKPVVYTYCYSSKKDSYSVNYDDKSAAYNATDLLIKLGHKKIGIISGLLNTRPSKARLEGCKQALEDNGLSLDPDLIKKGNWFYESGKKYGIELINKNDPPSAIFAFNDPMAAGVIAGIESLGLSVPEDLSVIGFDNRDFTRYVNPSLTTLNLPLKKIGLKAGDLVMKLLKNKEVEKKSYFLKCDLITRGSTQKL